MAKRLIVLTGTANFYPSSAPTSIITKVQFKSDAQYAQLVADALRQQGWDIVGVRLSQNLGRANITIEANVYDQYSAEDARISATNVLSNIQDGYIYNGNIFSNVSLRILSEGALPNATGDATLNTTLNTITGAASNLIGKTAVAGASNPTTPIMLVVGALALLILLRPQTVTGFRR